MVLMACSRSLCIVSKSALVLLLLVAAAFFSPAALATTQDVWIAVRTDGQPGTGTQDDPYDGSTPEKFDALMQGFAATQNLGIHLTGTGPFQTYATHSWFVRRGWVISGDGMDTTTVQMVGNVAGIHYGLICFSSDLGVATNNVIISDMTIDCNWAELSLTADDGAGGEKNIKTAAIALAGSNNLLDHVRTINSYGSWANALESFVVLLGGPCSGDGTNNVIQFCRAEQPQGNYGNPFTLAGWRTPTANHLLTNSRVVSCTAIGVNSGLPSGFNPGGVNVCNLKNCQIDGNTFIDCTGAAYTDTGTIEGLSITNNTVVRGSLGVGLMSTVTPKGKIEISGNSFSIQNRAPPGLLGAAIYVGQAAVTNITISNNTITFDTSGLGTLGFWGIHVAPVNSALVYSNVIGPIDPTAYPVMNAVTGTGVILSNNRQPNGASVPGL